VTGSVDKTALVVETTTGKELLRVPHEEIVYAVAFSPDGRYLATGSEDGTARVVETTNGKELIRVTHDGTVRALAFSPRRAVSGDRKRGRHRPGRGDHDRKGAHSGHA
jgi:WD40 repeat protein